MKKELLLIGYGMVGHRFLEEFKDLGGLGRWNVSVVSEEAVGAYDRVNLSKLFYEQSCNLFFPSTTVFEKDGIRFFYNSKVTKLDPQNHLAMLDDGMVFEFERCVLSTGSYPFVPQVQGFDNQRCFTYRSIANATQIIEKAKSSSTALVVGGGLLGIEAAGALQNLDLKVQVIEQSARVMPTQLDDQGSLLLEKKLQQQGLGLRLGHVVTRMQTRHDKSLDVELKSLITDSKNSIIVNTDMVVFSVGVRPNDHLARECGLAISPRGGIQIDSTCRTSWESIYAIGECASIGGRSYGLVGPGYQMAKAAACSLVGVPGEIAYLDTSTKLKLSGLQVASFGNPFTDKDHNKIIYCDPRNLIYRVLVVSKQKNKLLGGILLGDSSNFSILRSLVIDQQSQDIDLSDLVLPQVGNALDFDLPCGCNNVSITQVGDLIKQNQFIALAKIIKILGIDLDCKPCLANVKNLVSEANRTVVDPKQFVCFHFDYSIDELHEIISYHCFTDFDSLIQIHGRGRGCQDCKSVIGDVIEKQKLVKAAGM